MGQSHSDENPTLTKEQLSDQLALRFLRHCFSDIEIYSFRDNFKSLVQETYSHSSSASSSTPPGPSSSGATLHPHRILYWTEDTLTRFLGLPDALAPIGSILYQNATYLGAFPFEQDLAPVVVTFEALVKAVVFMTGRHEKVLRKGRERSKKRGIDWVKMVWKSFAVWEREFGVVMEKSNGEGSGSGGQTNNQLELVCEEETLFAIGDDEDDEGDESLTLAALDALDALEVFDLPEKQEKEKEQPKRMQIQSAQIPIENMRVIIMLLLLVAPLEPTQPIAVFVERFTAGGLASLKATAENVLRGFTSMSEDGKKGISWRIFKAAMKRSMPCLFDGFSPLYEHLLFSKNITMSSTATYMQRPPSSAASPTSPTSLTNPISPNILDLAQPLLPSPGQILNVDILCQISLFLPGSRLWRRLRPLYAGSSAGFSMGSFETCVLKWQAPTILLVSGSRMRSPETALERAFTDSLPQKKYPTSLDEGSERLVYGVYLNVPWKLSHKECFGDADTVLFQLAPVHEVFKASSSNKEYAHFNKTNGIAFGNQLPQNNARYNVPLHNNHEHQHFNLGPVSLTFDEGLVYGVFNHIGDGGAFLRSDTRKVSGDRAWQDRFEIEEVEVWGVGGDKEAEEQRRQWAWEDREALLRRNINLGNDIEADRALLEMAGLIGQNRSGGSIG